MIERESCYDGIPFFDIWFLKQSQRCYSFLLSPGNVLLYVHLISFRMFMNNFGSSSHQSLSILAKGEWVEVLEGHE